ncbi:tripartite tricarboxylate transporter substrate binding protein [Haloferax sp. AB510]|uniref:Bug family tripartite tricarboxylate transporter substrate binding protein n=1 Tax=Haloferax sp. AB510 TaxID=2934172 RepID=UPI00209C5A06|nr:tripartite tricarboxylate transporter substrate binding protein [Haloferax sp. AB510]MCO8268274.1 tripartite tricarboxylate transporter substrate binding protein [Haloferax sp. AB510]
MAHDTNASMTRRGFMAAAGAGTVALSGCSAVQSELQGGGGEYPSEDISYIVPFSQGGGTDTYARKIMPQVSNELDSGIAIENVPGAASLKGAAEILRSEPDGYTFGGFNPPSTPISYLVHQPDWDMTKLMPVCTYARTPYGIFANPEHNIEGLKDLVNRYQSGDLKQFAGLGRGGIVNLAAIVMKNDYGLNYNQYVAYDGAGPAIKAAVSGEVPVVATTDTAAQSAVESGDLEAVSILSSEGSSVFPEAPSPSDTGFKSIDYIGQLTRCMFLPPETPTDVRDTLAEGVKAALQTDEVQTWSEQTGNIVEYGSHERAKKALVNSINTIPDKVNMSKLRGE